MSDAQTVTARTQSFGRPWYRPELDEQVHKLALLGLTDEEMADNLQIDISTFYRWKAKKRSFREAILRAGARADADVAVGLHQRAKGFTYRAVKVFGPTKDNPEPTTVEYDEYIPPETAAASLWLRNRQGAKWRDKTDVQHSGTISLEAWVLEARPPKQANPTGVIEGQVKRLDDGTEREPPAE